MTALTEQPRTVYFIKPIGMNGPVKIGCSHSPDGRRSTLETWSPFPLEITAEIPGSLIVERRFHAYFMKQHKSREWFDWSPDLQRVIDAINSGTFDVETLPAPRAIRAGTHAKWSEESRLRASFGQRMWRTEKKSGFSAPITHYSADLEDSEQRGLLEAFFSAPHVHGRPIKAPWAEKKRAEWLGQVSA